MNDGVQPISGATPPARPRAGGASWRRAALWGFAAAAALTVAVFAASTDAGRGRLEALVGNGPARALNANSIVQPDADPAAAARRASDAVNARLAARIETLERRLEAITASIGRLRTAAWIVLPPPDYADAMPHALFGATPDAEAAPAAENPATGGGVNATSAEGEARTGFGLDLGTAASVDALRAAWLVVRNRHGAELKGLYPVVQLQGRTRTGGLVLHLVAGPLPSAADRKSVV